MMSRSLFQSIVISIFFMAELIAMQQPLIHFRTSAKKSYYYSQRDLFDSPVLLSKHLDARSKNNALLRKIDETPNGIRLYNNAIDKLKESDWHISLQSYINALSDKDCRLLTNIAGRLENSRLLIALSYRWLGLDVVNCHIAPYVMDPAIQIFRKNIIVTNIVRQQYAMNEYCHDKADMFELYLKSINDNIVRIKETPSTPLIESHETGLSYVVRRVHAPTDKPWLIVVKDSRTSQTLCTLLQKKDAIIKPNTIKESVFSALGTTVGDRNVVVLLDSNSIKVNCDTSKDQCVRVFELYNDEQAKTLEALKNVPLTLFQAKKIHDISKEYDYKLITKNQAYESCKECLQPVAFDKILKLDICFPK